MESEIKTTRTRPSAQISLKITGATLLSVEEANGLPEKLKTIGICWWLRSPGKYSEMVAYVSSDGEINATGGYAWMYVSDLAVRPALRISDVNGLAIGDTFTFGGETFELISDTLAFCRRYIGRCIFNDYYGPESADTVNVYEGSKIQKYVEKWFSHACSQNKKQKKEGVNNGSRNDQNRQREY